MRHADSALIGSTSEIIEVVRQVKVAEEVYWIAFDERMIEETLKNLTNGTLTDLNGFGFMAIEPTLS